MAHEYTVGQVWNLYVPVWIITRNSSVKSSVASGNTNYELQYAFTSIIKHCGSYFPVKPSSPVYTLYSKTRNAQNHFMHF